MNGKLIEKFYFRFCVSHQLHKIYLRFIYIFGSGFTLSYYWRVWRTDALFIIWIWMLCCRFVFCTVSENQGVFIVCYFRFICSIDLVFVLILAGKWGNNSPIGILLFLFRHRRFKWCIPIIMKIYNWINIIKLQTFWCQYE